MVETGNGVARRASVRQALETTERSWQRLMDEVEGYLSAPGSGKRIYLLSRVGTLGAQVDEVYAMAEEVGIFDSPMAEVMRVAQQMAMAKMLEVLGAEQ